MKKFILSTLFVFLMAFAFAAADDLSGSPTVSFTMTVPAKTAGTYIGTVTGTDTSNSANTESLPYSLVINSEDSFSVSTSSLTFDLQEDSESQTFTVTNDGSTTLSSWNFTFTSSDGDVGKILDNDDDTLVISFSGGSSTLVPGASMTLSVTANPDTDMDFGSYSGTIAVSATGSSTVSGSIS